MHTGEAPIPAGREVHLSCLVDTGATMTLLRKDLFISLGLEASGVFLGVQETTCVYGLSKHVARFLIAMRFEQEKKFIFVQCGVPLRLDVDQAAVFSQEQRMRTSLLADYIDDTWPDENILGMRSILCQRMLCFSPSYLYVFERKNQLPVTAIMGEK